ncbi:MAG: site-2 protease family protein [Chloroflexi bacterium]|nr:MAG: site-2 protease family protein [Chloroflexota bacterium]TMG72201.1 MAG: site-2 protease family protein [Chloroflexota bacterium]
MIARGAGGPFGGPQGPYLLILILLLLAFLNGSLAAPILGLIRDPTEENIVLFVGFIVAIVLGITVHEFMHAFTAHRLGDDTGRLLGRMSLNPLAHLDPFGSLLLVLAGFGYGKPVPVNESRLQGGRSSWAAVALAGPLANFAIAGLCAIPLRFAVDVSGGVYFTILESIVFYNVVLGLFNLIPIPPLDGSRVVYALLPPREAHTWRTFEGYGPLVLMAIFFFGFRYLNAIVYQPAQAILRYLTGS